MAMDTNVKVKRQLAEMGNTLNSYISEKEFPKLNIKQPIKKQSMGIKKVLKTY